MTSHCNGNQSKTCLTASPCYATNEGGVRGVWRTGGGRSLERKKPTLQDVGVLEWRVRVSERSDQHASRWITCECWMCCGGREWRTGEGGGSEKMANTSSRVGVGVEGLCHRKK